MHHYLCLSLKLYDINDYFATIHQTIINETNNYRRCADMNNILSTILRYRDDRNCSEYQLAEKSGLPQFTISSWYRKNMVPTIPSLEKVCTAFGITLSQLFADDSSPVSLNNS